MRRREYPIIAIGTMAVKIVSFFIADRDAHPVFGASSFLYILDRCSMYFLMESATRSALSNFANSTSSEMLSQSFMGLAFRRRDFFGLSKVRPYSSTAIRSLPFMVLSIGPVYPAS